MISMLLPEPLVEVTASTVPDNTSEHRTMEPPEYLT